MISNGQIQMTLLQFKHIIMAPKCRLPYFSFGLISSKVTLSVLPTRAYSFHSPFTRQCQSTYRSSNWSL